MRIKSDSLTETKTSRTLRTPETARRRCENGTQRDTCSIGCWCTICVVSRGRSSPHKRVVVNKTADTLPKFQTDHMFIQQNSAMCHMETRSGVVISFMCARKGGYEDLTKEILRHFEADSFLNPVIIQCDKKR